MTITTSDKEESATRSVETLPAGNLVDPTRNDDTIVYRSLSLSTAGPTLLAPEARDLDSSLMQGFGSLGGKGPTMTPFEPVGLGIQQPGRFALNAKEEFVEEVDEFGFSDFGSSKASQSKLPARPDETSNTTVSTPPIKPSYISYRGDYFSYNGDMTVFHEKLHKAALECGADLKYKSNVFEYDVLAYPSDDKIQYSIQIYGEAETNGYVVEFRRLEGAVFTYRNHVMKMFKSLQGYNIGPGVPSDAKPSMPKLDLSVGTNDDDYKPDAKTLAPVLKMASSRLLDVSRAGLQMLISATKAAATQDALKDTKTMTTVIEIASRSEVVEIDRCTSAILREACQVHHEEIVANDGVELVLERLEKFTGQNTLAPVLKMASSRLLDVSRAGLQMLISATKAAATQDALKDTKTMTTVIEIASRSEVVEIDRCTSAILREACQVHHEEIVANDGVELVLERLEKFTGQNVSNHFETLEVQRNCIGILSTLCQSSNGKYLAFLRQKGAGILVGKIISSTKCERVKRSANVVAKLLKPF
eukprot:g9173.t1